MVPVASLHGTKYAGLDYPVIPAALGSLVERRVTCGGKMITETLTSVGENLLKGLLQLARNKTTLSP